MTLKKTCVALALAVCGMAGSLAHAESSAATYQITNTFKVGGPGRWDYASTDASGKILFVTRGNHVQAIDTTSGTVLADIKDLKGTHGVALAADVNRGFISDGKAAAVVIFDLKTYAVLGTIPAADDADAIIYDPASKLVLAFCGDAHQLVAIDASIDPKATKPTATLDLGGQPESAVSDGAGKVFVVITDTAELVAIDTKTMTIAGRYPLGSGKHPAGLAIDREHHRLFAGCRNKKMVVLNSDDGKVVGEYPIGGGNDAAGFALGSAFASNGDGTLDVIKEITPDQYEVTEVKTVLGARTMAADPVTGAVYLPAAEMTPAAAPTAENPKPRPTPVPGSFKILVVSQMAGK